MINPSLNMPVFVWDSRYETGIDMVDTQHRRLVEILNTLGDLYAQGARNEEIVQTLDALADYSVYHFQMEEELMARYQIDPDHLEGHKQSHASFVKQALTALDKVQENAVELTGGLLTFLTKWLIFHILGVDQRMAAEIHALEGGASHERARQIGEEAMTESSSVLLGAFNQMYENLSVRTHAYWDAAQRLQREVSERERAESELAARLHELTCLTDISAIMERRELSLVHALKDIITRIPAAWQFPVGVCLECPEGLFATHDQQESPNTPRATVPVMVDQVPYGTLTVWIRDPSIKECSCNHRLLNLLGERIGDFIERRQALDARRKLSLAVEQSPVSIVITDRNGIIEYVNNRFTTLTGYTREEALGRTPSLLKSDATPGQVYANLWSTITQGKVWEGEFLNQKKNGEQYWESANISPILGPDGEITHFLAVKQDITERKAAERALQDSNAKLSTSLAELQAHAKEMVVLNRMTDLIQTCISQEEACRVVEEAAGELFGGLGGSLAVKNSREGFLETVAHWGQGCDSEPVFSFDDCWAMRRGHPHHVEAGRTSVRCTHIVGDDTVGYLCLPLIVVGETIGLVTMAKPTLVNEDRMRNWQQLAVAFGESIKMSISNLRLRKALKEQAVHDPLTGLFNRRYLDDTLPRELYRAMRTERPLSVVLIDIDHFKRFNDTYGHKAGDLVLQAVARSMESGLRKSDLACRYGGEEFVLVFPEMDGKTACQRVDMMRDQVFRLRVDDGDKTLPPITLSAGIASTRKDYVEQEVLLRAADSALYTAKQSGRNCTVLYDPEASVVTAAPVAAAAPPKVPALNMLVHQR